ncbi:MAG: alpha/beta hydrolase [Candidatus Hermodarchaeia archaeon]|jgi:pimeloyl-ACP methyl ester carboxylesterase
MRQLRPRYIVFLIGMLMMVSGIAMAFGTQNNLGTVQTTQFYLITGEGVPIHSTLQVPNAATPSTPLPGVIVIHGVMGTKEWIMGFGIELARRGFVVLTIDAVGHGNSGPSLGSGTDRGGIVALEFLASLPYVSTIGMVGHSMGSGVASQAINASSVQVDSFVIVGGGGLVNSTYPNNVLIVTGLYDELFNIPGLLNALATPFNTTAPVIPGQLYGSFATGTARKVVIPPSNHLFEIIDPSAISESVDWLMNSLKGSPDAYWIPAQNQIYPIWILGGLIACIGAMLSVLALFTILINFGPFRQIQHTPNSSYFASTPKYLGLGLLYGVSGLVTLFALLLVDIPIYFTQGLGLSVALGILAGGLVTLLILLGIKFYQNNKSKNPPTWNDYGGFNGKPNTLLKTIGLGFLLGFIGIAWLYLWVLPVDLLLALDFRAFLPFLKAISPARAIYVPIYFLLLLPFVLIEALWLMGLLRTAPKDTLYITQTVWTLKAIFIKILLYASIIIIQGVGSIALGSALISGSIGFQLIYLYMFIPFFAVSTTVIAWSYRLSNRHYIAILFNALLFAWLMASILPIYI